MWSNRLSVKDFAVVCADQHLCRAIAEAEPVAFSDLGQAEQVSLEATIGIPAEYAFSGVIRRREARQGLPRSQAAAKGEFGPNLRRRRLR